MSTFEGTANVDDWAPGAAIRGAVGEVYFVPDWSSLGASGVATHSSNIEGAFSWALWPDGANNMTTGTDLWYQNTLTDKSYMMGVSPWFFHSASGGYQWVWRGDDLWADRWAQVLEIQPEFVQCVPHLLLLACLREMLMDTESCPGTTLPNPTTSVPSTPSTK